MNTQYMRSGFIKASLLAAILVVLALIAIFLQFPDNDKPAMPTIEIPETEDGFVSSGGSNESVSMPSSNFSGQIISGKGSPLLDFNKPDYDSALASSKLIVLYFYANWCPICRAEFPLMQSAFDELGGEDTVGFRVNYNDNQTDSDEIALAREFGVAYQHTKVFVKNRTRILKSPESWSRQRYLDEINKANSD